MKGPHSYYIIDDKVYDLKEWIPVHPGGSLWFSRSYGRDISTLIYTYHNNPENCKKILARFETDIPLEKALDPWLNVPRFLLPADFNLKRDTLAFDFTQKDSILDRTRKILATKEMRERTKHMDFLFDVTAFALFVAHLFMSFYGVYYEVMPPLAFVIFFLCTRTGMAACGHYHSHRKKDGFADWGEPFFDMQYVGASIVTFDGHVLGHHTQTNATVDPKRTVFTGLLELPRIWRVPAETLRRWGHTMSGMTIRWATLLILDQGNHHPSLLKNAQFLFFRALLNIEFFFYLYTGNLYLWIAQFTVTIWWNLFLIVSSHDFDMDASQTDEVNPGNDWGKFQISISTDMSVTGNQYIDCFMTAGLGCHRVHHLLPGQKSGFSNAITVPIVQKLWEEDGHKWLRTQNFVIDRIPINLKRYVFAPSRGLKGANFILECLSPTGLIKTILFIGGGFLGFGQI